MQDPIEVAADAGARLDALGVAWVIGGSIASSVHGEARSTQDVDMVVALLDFFVAGDDPFEAERLRSRQRIDMSNALLYVDTAEHTLLRKLEWYRRGGEVSERQWRDVQAIARIQGDRLDRAHVRFWAGQLGVTDLLERVMRDS